MIRKILPIVLFLFAVAPAFGTVTFTPDPSTLSGLPGDEVIFQGTVTSDSDVFLNGICVSFTMAACDINTSPGPAFLTLDTNVFYLNAPGSLDIPLNNRTYTGPVFGILIDPAALLGSYPGIVTFLGGSESDPNGAFAFDPQGSGNFQVDVVPEPGTLGLLSAGLVLLAFRISRRRLPAGRKV